MVASKKDILRGSAEVQEVLSRLDVDIVGVARLDDASDSRLEESARKLLPKASSIVVLAMEIYPEILDLSAPKRIMGEASLNDLLERHSEYLNGRLTHAVYDIAKASRKAGLKALPLPAFGCLLDARFMKAVLSYKHAGQTAGLGYIGRSSLLITPDCGPKVRLAICLTEASLKPTPAEYFNECDGCNICIDNCPSGALSKPEAEEPYIINKFACQAFRSASGGCLECMRLCPRESEKHIS